MGFLYIFQILPHDCEWCLENATNSIIDHVICIHDIFDRLKNKNEWKILFFFSLF